MLIRRMEECDFFDVALLHSLSGLDYQIPDLAGPLVVAKHVAYDEGGRLLGAGIYRLQAEAYLWLDFRQSPRVRLQVVRALSRSLAGELFKIGIDCAVAYLPASLPATFRRFLKKISWSSDRVGWQSWSKPIEESDASHYDQPHAGHGNGRSSRP